MSRAGRYSHALQSARDINNYAELGIVSIEEIQWEIVLLLCPRGLRARGNFPRLALQFVLINSRVMQLLPSVLFIPDTLL